VKAAELKRQGRALDLDTPRGIAAYLEWIAREYPQVACAMLCRLMPQQQQTDVKVEHRYQTFEEIAARLRELGVEPRRIYPLLTEPSRPQLLTRRALDGRTNAARHFDRLVVDIERDLGGRDQLSTIERSLVEAFCGARVIAAA
jgi:hypothetical protein